MESLENEIGKTDVNLYRIFGKHAINQQLQTLFGTKMEEEKILRIYENNE